MISTFRGYSSGKLGSFYQNSPILRSEPAVRDARLRLCALFGEVLKTGLNLLGIATPRRI